MGVKPKVAAAILGTAKTGVVEVEAHRSPLSGVNTVNRQRIVSIGPVLWSARIGGVVIQPDVTGSAIEIYHLNFQRAVRLLAKRVVSDEIEIRPRIPGVVWHLPARNAIVLDYGERAVTGLARLIDLKSISAIGRGEDFSGPWKHLTALLDGSFKPPLTVDVALLF